MYRREWNAVAEGVNFGIDIDLGYFIAEVPVACRVLDFGCGYGRVSSILSDAGYRNLVGVDSSVKMIERGKQQFPELSLELTSGARLPFPDSSFDAVIVCAVFTCITSQEARLCQINELCRILKPKGLLHMVEFCSEPSRAFTPSIGVPMLHSSSAELRELVDMLNIEKEEIVSTQTIGDNSANGYRIFARK